MPDAGGALVLDMSTRKTGWAYGAYNDDSRAVYGLWLLPGMADLGKLYACLRNCIDDAVAIHRPSRLCFAPALFRDAQTAAEALLGLVSVARLCCYDLGIQPKKIAESTARKAILGRGTFGLRGDDGKVIKGTGSREVKAAAMEWCRNKGWVPQSDDVADALVLLEYERRGEMARHGLAR